MRTTLIALILALCCSVPLSAQSTGTNFSVKDCNNNQHDLFSTLDSGKVVILVWVMPCGSCIGPAKTSYNVSQSFKSSHPDKIRYFLIDDYGNSTCASTANWGASNGVKPHAVFSDASIKMSDYGSDGMPKVVILGGPNHTIFFNKNNADAGNATDIQAAINSALSAATSIEEPSTNNIHLFPNPAATMVHVVFSEQQSMPVSLEITNLIGETVASYVVNESVMSDRVLLQVSDIPNGLYMIRVQGRVLRLAINRN